jgi:hypothetical protein
MKGKYSRWGTLDGNISDQEDLQAALDGKQDKEPGKGLSSEDFTAAEKAKLAGIEAGADATGIETYTHVQTVPAETWNVQHNFGTVQPLLLFVTDAGGDAVRCEADYPASTVNLLTLRFGLPVAGKAVVHKI